MKQFSIRPSISQVSTEVYFGRGILDGFNSPGKTVIIADEAISGIYGEPLASKLQADLLSLPPLKSKENLDRIYAFLFKTGSDRKTCIIALGGGAICDLTAFAASTYMRGAPLVLIPTTLLAMVDAAIGGKTAIDTPWGKNLIGSVYFPKSIIADLNLLKSLPEQELLNGRAEILKMGLIYDPSLWDQEPSDTLIYQAMRAKIAIIEQDPTEQGLRRILNFGHTIGHGLEHTSQNELSHGMAVALGSLAESHLSMQLGLLSKADFEKIQIPYQQFSLSLPKRYTRENLMKAMKYDKKKRGDQLRFVLIDRIGKAISYDGSYCRAVSEEELHPTLDWLEKIYG